jgi:hypothetical protein
VPPVPPPGEFRQERAQHYAYGKPDVSPKLRDRYEWPAKIIYPSMLANTGMITCYGVPLEFRSGAVGSDQAGYRGLVFLNGPGSATIEAWAPNSVRVRVQGAGAGTQIVYDTSFDPGWRVDGRPAEAWRGLVSGPVAAGDSTVELRYRPVGLAPGLLLFALTLVVWSVVLLRQRRGGAVTTSAGAPRDRS